MMHLKRELKASALRTRGRLSLGDASKKRIESSGSYPLDHG